MKILLLGADGQVGHELRRSLAPLGRVVDATISGQLPGGVACEALDFVQPGHSAALVARTAPDWVVNAAAYTAVDRAEQEPELAQRINAGAVAEIALACVAAGARLVHYSTDYVFDGSATRPYREDDATGPLGVYGASKLAGEQAVRDSGVPHLLFRLCWVYGSRGQNFLRTMLRLAAERDNLRVVADQRGAPTPARWIANATALAIARRPDASGTWHLAADGENSWHGFACEIISRAKARGLLARIPAIDAIATPEFPTPARRPAYSRLDLGKLEADFGLRLPDWSEGLDQVLDDLAT